MSEHLSAATMNAIVDGELETTELARAEAHLAGCLQCSSECLSIGILKRRVRAAGAKYELPEGLEQRMRRAVAPTATKKPAVWIRWGAVAAVVAVCAALVPFEYSRTRHRAEESALVSEVVDQHIAVLAANAPPQVVSSDRHTVKPWFQGKLPFSFNLPQTLPADVTLDGANLSYLEGRPVAQLLFRIGKHRASVFVEQRGGAAVSPADQAGFHVAGFQTAELEAVAVSDTDRARLTELMQALQAAQ
jgi:anti-sigma factor RsiW